MKSRITSDSESLQCRYKSIHTLGMHVL